MLGLGPLDDQIAIQEQRELQRLEEEARQAAKLTDDEIGFLFLTIPQAVKDAVTDQMWAYACSQYRLDPSPNKEMPLDQQLLSYVYRTRNGRPALEWGVKEDLPHRMRHADRFHPPILTEGQGAAPTLPPVSNPLLQGGI